MNWPAIALGTVMIGLILLAIFVDWRAAALMFIAAWIDNVLKDAAR